MLIILAMLLCAVQLCLCIKSNKLWVKLLPAQLMAAGLAFCIAAYFVAVWLEENGVGIYGAAFSAYFCGLMLAVLLAGNALAWMVYGIVKLYKKQKKTL